MEQVLDTMASDPCRDPELGKMGADRIDHGGLLPDEEMARAVEHQAALLLGRLGLHKPHVCPGDHFDGTYVPVEEPSTASKTDIQAISVHRDSGWRAGVPNGSHAHGARHCIRLR